MNAFLPPPFFGGAGNRKKHTNQGNIWIEECGNFLKLLSKPKYPWPIKTGYFEHPTLAGPGHTGSNPSIWSLGKILLMPENLLADALFPFWIYAALGFPQQKCTGTRVQLHSSNRCLRSSQRVSKVPKFHQKFISPHVGNHRNLSQVKACYWESTWIP